MRFMTNADREILSTKPYNNCRVLSDCNYYSASPKNNYNLSIACKHQDTYKSAFECFQELHCANNNCSINVLIIMCSNLSQISSSRNLFRIQGVNGVMFGTEFITVSKVWAKIILTMDKYILVVPVS